VYEHKIVWTRVLWEAMCTFTSGAVYMNNLGEEGEERVRAAYVCLAAVKAKYDPDNVFRLNQNIPPAWASPGSGSAVAHRATIVA
jgi:hypothetical protein